MRKNITIPYGYSVANNDIGNSALVSGMNYEFWYADIGAVRTLLGESTYDLGQLCRSANINKWAAFKPTRTHPQTQPQHYHGMYIGIGADIEYRGPRSSEADPRDLGHFLGYNHNALAPGVFTLIGGTIYYESSTTINRSFQLTLPEFDVRTVHNSIDRVIRQQLGQSGQSSIVLTDAMQSDRFVSGQISVQTDMGVARQTVQIQMWLGFDLGGGNFELMCNYPSAQGGEYIATFYMYRVVAGMASLTYQNAGMFEPPNDEIRMTCLTVHSSILVSYGFQGQRTQTEGDFSDPTLVNVSQSSSTSSTGLVSQPPDGYYRFRTILTYVIDGTQDSKTSDWSYITIGMGGGGT